MRPSVRRQSDLEGNLLDCTKQEVVLISTEIKLNRTKSGGSSESQLENKNTIIFTGLDKNREPLALESKQSFWEMLPLI